MSTLIKNKLNNTFFDNIRPSFTMLVGVPGSGKSTYAKVRLTKDPAIVYLSSDAIRGELWHDESCQDNNSLVFNIMKERALEALRNGKDVIYDATNINRKNRNSILIQIPDYVLKECIVVWAPIEECIQRDAARDRTVGEEVIWSMLKRFEAPFYDEGFHSINTYITNEEFLLSNHRAREYFEACVDALHIPHDNPHHSVGVAEHCELCGKYLEDLDVPQIVKFAGYIHDIGKPLTKTFVNTKGETTEIAHYYGHQAVGAWITYGFPESDPTLAWLVSTHMAPFIKHKYYNSLDPLYKNWINALHTADRAAH